MDQVAVLGVVHDDAVPVGLVGCYYHQVLVVGGDDRLLEGYPRDATDGVFESVHHLPASNEIKKRSFQINVIDLASKFFLTGYLSDAHRGRCPDKVGARRVARFGDGQNPRSVLDEGELLYARLFVFEDHLLGQSQPDEYVAGFRRYDVSEIVGECEFTIRDTNERAYFPSGVMMACVTMAPKGLSASFATSFPIRKSHTPTQFLVAVTAKLRLSDKLEKKKKNPLQSNFHPAG